MVKCGPKPRTLTARQLRNLVREEKRTLSLQRQAAQAPPSPCKKKVWVRPSQYDVSLARKKRVKARPRQVAPRKARSESSIAFSAITEEIPLFEELKRTNRLVYVHVPQQPVPLVWPQTPTREASCFGSIISPTTTIAKSEYYGTPSGVTLSVFSGPLNEQSCLLSTPIASSTPLRTPTCSTVALLSHSVDLVNLEDTPALDKILFQDEAVIITSSPKPAPSIVTIHTGISGIQSIEKGSSEDCTFTPTPSGKGDISAEQLLGFAPPSKGDSPRRQDSGSLSRGSLEQRSKRIILPTIRPLVIQRRSQSLQSTHILTQLPIEQDSETIARPRVQLPRTLLRSPMPVYRNVQATSPETIYQRSLMSSFWAKPSESPNLKDQPLEDAFFVPCEEKNVNPVLKSGKNIPGPPSVHPNQCKASVLATEKMAPLFESPLSCLENQRCSSSNFIQPDTTHVIQSVKPKPGIHIEDPILDSSRPKRRMLGIYKGHNSLGVDGTAGAFANAILRQTGHLKRKDDDTPNVPVVQNDRSFRHDTPAIKHGTHDRYVSPRFQGQLIPLYLPGNGTLTRTANIPPRLGLDEPKMPLAPAAVIKDDPFKRPLMRPGRKRFLPKGRIIAYRLESTTNDQTELQETSLWREPLIEQITPVGKGKLGLIADKAVPHDQIPNRPSISQCSNSASLRRKRHWTKRVVADDICHHISTDSGLLNMQSESKDDQPHVSALPPPMATIPPSESERSIKKRVTTEFSKKGTMFMALKAVYNKLWA